MPDPPPTSVRITQLEEVVTHQQKLLHELNEVLITLRCEHERLRDGLQRRLDRLETLLESQSPAPDPLEKPPHY